MINIWKFWNRYFNSTADTRIEERRKFEVLLPKLFDISTCKCENFEKWRCPKKGKAAVSEREFLLERSKKPEMIILWTVDGATKKESREGIKLDRNPCQGTLKKLSKPWKLNLPPLPRLTRTAQLVMFRAQAKIMIWQATQRDKYRHLYPPMPYASWRYL